MANTPPKVVLTSLFPATAALKGEKGDPGPPGTLHIPGTPQVATRWKLDI